MRVRVRARARVRVREYLSYAGVKVKLDLENQDIHNVANQEGWQGCNASLEQHTSCKVPFNG